MAQDMTHRWMQAATHDMDKGALRRMAARRGLIKGSEPLTMADVRGLEREGRASGNTQLVRRAVMARTLMKGA